MAKEYFGLESGFDSAQPADGESLSYFLIT